MEPASTCEACGREDCCVQVEVRFEVLVTWPGKDPFVSTEGVVSLGAVSRCSRAAMEDSVAFSWKGEDVAVYVHEDVAKSAEEYRETLSLEEEQPPPAESE